MFGEGNEVRAEEDLNSCFEKLMMVVGGEGQVKEMEEYGVIEDWNDIPMELLLRIMSLLDDCTVIMASGVCKGWRDAIGLGLTHLSLVRIPTAFSAGVDQISLNDALNLGLKLSFGTGWFLRLKKNMNNLVLSLAPKFTKLQTLALRQDVAQLEDNAVEAIATHCYELQDLDLSKSFKLTDRSLIALAHGCANLTKLNISGCSAFSDDVLVYLTNFCRKLKTLNLCGCVRSASDRALQAIGHNCNQMQSLNLGWCDNVHDAGVVSLAYGCPDLRVLDLCGCVHITDESVIALANRCPGLMSLGLYYCQNITDRAMYSLAHSGVRRKCTIWESRRCGGDDAEGLKSLNISQCTALTPLAVQAVCDSFPALHTCPGRHSLIISGCLNLTSVHCACGVQARRLSTSLPDLAHPRLL